MVNKINSKLEKAKIRVNRLTMIFSIVYFSLFVLIVFKNYSNITAVKYLSFSFISIAFSGYYIFEKGCIVLTNDPNKPKKKRHIMPYVFLSLFVFFNIAAALFSPYVHYVNSIGQSVLLFGSGRYDGLVMLSLFILLFLCFSFEGTFGEHLVHTCAVTTFIMVFIGFLQFAGLNPFYFYPAGKHNHLRF